jgi:hypothetical protein
MATACVRWSSIWKASRIPDFVEKNIPTGIPLVYELDVDTKPIRHYYLWDAERVRTAMQASANHVSLKHQMEARS